jgi:hypothetical protein
VTGGGSGRGSIRPARRQLARDGVPVGPHRPSTPYIVSILALVAALSAVPGVAAAGPQPPECPLLSQPTGVDHPLPGTALVARDPYSGLFSRTGTFRFSVRGPRAALDGVARVMWALDGVTRRVDDRGPSFEWIGSSSSGMPAGDHNVTVTVVPTSGPPVSVEFGLTATDCRYVDFQAFPPRRPGRGTTELLWDSAWESDDGVSLSDVAARAERNIVSALPAGLRGERLAR